MREPGSETGKEGTPAMCAEQAGHWRRPLGPLVTRDPLRNRPEQWEAGVCTPDRCPPLMEGGSGGK